MKTEPNEIAPEMLSFLAAANFMPGTISASRAQMLASHLGQHLVTKESEERLIQTGAENKFGKFTFNVKMPVDGRIIKLIQRYPPSYSADAIAHNPQTIVIFEDEITKEVDYISLEDYCSMHPYFGFRYQAREAMQKLARGMPIRKGEVFLDSPAVNANGGYGIGLNLNVAFMDHPAVAEDGFGICRDVLPRLAFNTYLRPDANFGSRSFAINLYGDDQVYKAFPDIGEYVAEHGILMALRDYNDELSVVNMSSRATRKLDPVFDRQINVGRGGRVIDIRVWRQNGNNQSNLPPAMQAQLLKYEQASRYFYQDILNEYRRLKRDHGDRLRITPNFSALVRDAVGVVGTGTGSGNQSDTVKLVHKNMQLDEWRIEFVIEHVNIPNMGAKLTSLDGGKGVICQILEPEDMPVDEHGNRVDVIMDGKATSNRMNFSRFYELYFNAAARDLMRELAPVLGITKETKDLYKVLTRIEENDRDLMNRVWDRLLGFYKIISPQQYSMFIEGTYQGTRVDHLLHIFTMYFKRNHGPNLFYPPNNTPEGFQQIRELEEKYKPLYGPVTYRGNSGRLVKTKRPIRVAPLYVILLEKVADDYSAVSSGKFQNFGVLAKAGASDKFSRPTRINSVRAIGESEDRPYRSYCGGHLMAELMDRNNNPITHRHMVENIFQSPTPTNIHSIVDRKKIPYGGSKPLQHIKHMLECAGAQYIYETPVPIANSKLVK
jgi:hypothetical protein